MLPRSAFYHGCENIDGGQQCGDPGPADAADALLSALLGGLLPLVSALLLLPYGPEPQRLAIRLGQNRSRRLLARVLRVSLWVTILFTGLAAFGLGRARGLHSPLLPLDLLATVPATALGALTTCLFFSAVRMHLGRWGVLIGLALTWTFGQAELAASAALPSGHLRHLLNLSGDALPLPLWGSSLSLLAFALLSIGAILLRARR